MNKQLKKEMLTIKDLPSDIHDTIAFFLPDKDLLHFLCASRLISVSAYLRRDRQRAHWKKRGVAYLARKGDLAGLQYMHSIGVAAQCTTYAMNWAAENGHLAVVEFLHGVGAPCTANAMGWAAEHGHLAVVEFLHGIGAPYTADAMEWAAGNGHLAVVQFLHGVGAPYTHNAMNWAASHGHLAVVQFLHGIGAPYTADAMNRAAMDCHLDVVEFFTKLFNKKN